LKEKVQDSHVSNIPPSLQSIALLLTSHASPSVALLSLRHLQHIALFAFKLFNIDLVKAKNQRAAKADTQIKPPKAK
jgi:hypothetical protein